MRCENINDYLKLYQMCDVLLLADIFEKFRHMCLANYGFYPDYYYTNPNLFWDACLLKSKVELKLIQEKDSEIYLMFEFAKRGVIAGTGSQRFAVPHECLPDVLQQSCRECECSESAMRQKGFI